MRHVIGNRAFRHTTPILLDVSDALGSPTAEEILMLAQTWRLMAPRSRGAIVYPEGDKLRVAKRIEQLSDGRVRAFVDRQAAMDGSSP